MLDAGRIANWCIIVGQGICRKAMVDMADVEVRELWVDRPGGRIFGRLYLPEDATGPLPAVICSHFFSGLAEDSGQWAQLMAEHGIAAYAFDFAGGSRKARSTGVSTLENSVKTEAVDLSCILDAISALPEVDEHRVYLLGQSQGGFVSTMVAEERPEDVAGLFLLYPALLIHEEMWDRFGSIDNVPETFIKWQRLGRAYAVDAMEYDPYQHMSYPGPVRIWHGDSDSLVPALYSKRAAKRYADCTFELVPGADHAFEGEDQIRIADAIAKEILG